MDDDEEMGNGKWSMPYEMGTDAHDTFFDCSVGNGW